MDTGEVSFKAERGKLRKIWKHRVEFQLPYARKAA